MSDEYVLSEVTRILWSYSVYSLAYVMWCIVQVQCFPFHENINPQIWWSGEIWRQATALHFLPHFTLYSPRSQNHNRGYNEHPRLDRWLPAIAQYNRGMTLHIEGVRCTMRLIERSVHYVQNTPIFVNNISNKLHLHWTNAFIDYFTTQCIQYSIRN